MTKPVIQLIIAMTAIICLTTIEIYALYQGIDGLLFTIVVAIIAGIAGFEAKPLISAFKSRKKS